MTARRVLLASSNPGKLREMEEILRELDVEISPQSEFNIGSVAETGLTFVENALIKARNGAVGSGLATIADDSGIEVDALNGRPGIYSARYAGEEATDKTNLEKLLTDMAEVPEQERRCRFHCLMVYLRHPEDPVPIICHGVWEGRLLTSPRGDNGFGYDPIFYVPDEDCSSAELSPSVKNRLSHRSMALRELVSRLASA